MGDIDVGVVSPHKNKHRGSGARLLIKKITEIIRTGEALPHDKLQLLIGLSELFGKLYLILSQRIYLVCIFNIHPKVVLVPRFGNIPVHLSFVYGINNCINIRIAGKRYAYRIRVLLNNRFQEFNAHYAGYTLICDNNMNIIISQDELAIISRFCSKYIV